MLASRWVSEKPLAALAYAHTSRHRSHHVRSAVARSLRQKAEQAAQAAQADRVEPVASVEFQVYTWATVQMVEIHFYVQNCAQWPTRGSRAAQARTVGSMQTGRTYLAKKH